MQSRYKRILYSTTLHAKGNITSVATRGTSRFSYAIGTVIFRSWEQSLSLCRNGNKLPSDGIWQELQANQELQFPSIGFGLSPQLGQGHTQTLWCHERLFFMSHTRGDRNRSKKIQMKSTLPWRVSPVWKRIRSRILRKDKTLSDKHWSGLQRSNRCLLMSVFFLTVNTKTCKIWDDGSETSGFSPVHFRFVAN